MLLDITNSCHMGCPHCLQCATPEPQHMALETVERAYEFALKAKVTCIGISGGEPTENPDWSRIVRKFASGFLSVSFITNGAWLFDQTKTEEMISLLKEFKNIGIQISSFRGLYKDHEKTCEAVEMFKKMLKKNGLKHRLYFENDIKVLHMLSLGRAKEHDEYLQQSAADTANTTSCFSSAFAALQCQKLSDVIDALEHRGKACHPLVDWKGNLHWSESWLCPSFANIHEPYKDIERKALAWNPCGQCADYQKLLRHQGEKYLMAKLLYAMKGRPLCGTVTVK